MNPQINQRPRQQNVYWFFAFGLAYWLVFAILYLYAPGLRDDTEVSLLSKVQDFLNGGELYHAPEAGHRTSLLYGPYLYLFSAAWAQVLGLSIFHLKLIGVLLSLSSILIASRIGWIGAAMMATLFLPSGYATLTARGDVYLILITSLAIFILPNLSQTRRAIALGILAGLASGIKIHGFIYLIPACALVEWSGARILISISLSLLTLLIPFEMGSSLDHFLYWLKASAHHPRTLEDFITAILYASILFIPALKSKDRRMLFLSLVAALLVAIFASKAGAGRRHILPLIPYAIYLIKDGVAFKYLTAGLAIFCILLGIHNSRIDLSISNNPIQTALKQEVSQFLDAEGSKTFGLAFSENEFFSRWRFLPLIRKSPYLFDLSAINDMRLANLETPSSTYELFQNCRIEVWLAEKDKEPFFTTDYYGRNTPLVEPQWQIEFKKNYYKDTSGKYLDIWRCRQSH